MSNIFGPAGPFMHPDQIFCYRAPEKKCTFFQFLSTVHAKVANASPTNYIFLRSAINTLSIEHIKSPFFQNLKIGLECLLIEQSP